MSTPFLNSFTEAVMARLVAEDLLELEPESGAIAIHFISCRLGQTSKGGSLISAFSRAIIECPQVIELYADNDTIKEIVTDLPFTALPRGGGSH